MILKTAIPTGARRPVGIPRSALAAVAVVLAFAFGVTGCARPGPGTAKSTDELLTQLNADRSEIDKASDTMMKRIEVFNASRKPGEQTIQFSEIFAQDLNPDQRDVLNQLVEQERDVSYKSLLTKIIADRDTIKDLQEKMLHLEQSLPDKFVVAKKGDKHSDLAMAYLTNEAHLDPEKAKSVLKQVDQSEVLLAGNQVWFFYDQNNDSFRTYVTQGTAGQTPMMVRMAKTRKLTKERDEARNERDQVATQRDSAQAEAAAMDQARSQLESELATRQNSLFYHAASSRNLKDQGVLSTVFSKMKDSKGLSFDESLDLRQGTTITLVPQSYGLSEIKAVKLLPSIYQEGRDYTIETQEDHSSARVVILDPEVFRGKEVVLALGS